MWLEVPYWIDRVWVSKECVCFACDHSVRQDAQTICFICGVCMSDVISSLKSLRAGSQVFALVMFVSLCDFAYSVVGKESAVAMHRTPCYVVLVCHQYGVCKNYVGSVYVVV